MIPSARARRVTLEGWDGASVDAWDLGDGHWNGWARPWMTLAQVRAAVALQAATFQRDPLPDEYPPFRVDDRGVVFAVDGSGGASELYAEAETAAGEPLFPMALGLCWSWADEEAAS